MAQGARTAIVSGGNRGIGLAVARSLLASGMRVVVLARDARLGRDAVSALAAETGGDAAFVLGDLGSLAGARAAAAALRGACPRIDALVHNAGVWPASRIVGEDGLEQAFLVNHAAPFVLNHLLEDRLAESGARVVQVSAGLYIKGKVDLEKTPSGADFHPIRTYATTKLCNLLVMPRFAARFQARGVTLNALHPGVIRTGLGDRKGALGLALRVVKRLWKTPEQGAAPVVRLVVDRALDGVTGRYYHLEEEAALSPAATDEPMSEALWRATARLTGIGEREDG